MLATVAALAFLGQVPNLGSEHLVYGAPGYVAGDLGETLITRGGYAVLHSNKDFIPKWVAWHITKKRLSRSVTDRVDAFARDPYLASIGFGATPADYRNSGYDRGHMSPAADNQWSVTAQKECFYLSNILPQNGPLNQHEWKSLEDLCRRWAKKFGDLTIYSGPIFGKPLSTGAFLDPIGADHVTTPSWLFKIVVRKLPQGGHSVLAFECENTKPMPGTTPKSWLVSVRTVEQDTGLNFLNGLSPTEQDSIETSAASDLWQ